MITVGNIVSIGAAYMKFHLVKNDYWKEGEKEVAGVWFGLGCERLGLMAGAAVDEEHFGRLAINLHPITGKRITARNDGKRKSFSDIQLSAPKDVSVLALLGDDPRVQEAFRASVGVGLGALQKFAAVRERRGELATSDESRATGNLAAAVYFHDASRELDPQLHAHAVIPNCTWDEATGRFLALQSRDMMRSSAFARRAMYDDLARRLMACGYECYNMSTDGFSIRGVEHLRERFSRRTATVDEAAKAFEQREGRAPTNDERAKLVLATRSRKLAEKSTPEVRADQRAMLSADEQRNLAKLVAAAVATPEVVRDGPSPALVSDVATLDKYLAVGFSEANERKSVAWEWDALEASLAHAQAGDVALDPVALVERLRARGSGEGADLHAGMSFRVTTAQVLNEERMMANLALAGRDAFASPMADVGRLEAGQRQAVLDRAEEARKRAARESRADRGLPPDPELAEGPAVVVLSDEQMAAARLLAESKDAVSVLVGDAGTGKTSSLAALRDASGKSWVALGPTTRARDELKKGGFADADTLQSFLLSAKKQKAARGSVVLVDEAGTMGTPETRKLLEIARREKFRVVFVGDPKQHASVVRGDALRAILRESEAARRPGTNHALSVAQLKTVLRQQRTEDREISESLARGEFARAVDRQAAAGYIKQEKDESKLIEEAAKYLVDRRLALAAETPATGGAPGVVLGITPRWQDAERLNAAMRPLLREAGQLSGEDRQLRIIEPDGSFTAQGKRLGENYQAGKHALTWIRDCENIGAKAGQSWIVEGVEKDGLLVRPMDAPTPRSGKTRQAPAPARKVAWSDLRDANVGRIKEVSLAVGDDILMRASCRTGKKTSVANGTVQRVRGIGKDGRIQLVGGGVLPADFHGWTHGYGITSHKSQGASEREAVVVMGDAACSGASRRQWYVSSSRHKVAAKYFVADLDKVRTALSRDDSRELASEMVERDKKAIEPRTPVAKELSSRPEDQHFHRVLNLELPESDYKAAGATTPDQRARLLATKRRELFESHNEGDVDVLKREVNAPGSSGADRAVVGAMGLDNVLNWDAARLLVAKESEQFAAAAPTTGPKVTPITSPFEAEPAGNKRGFTPEEAEGSFDAREGRYVTQSSIVSGTPAPVASTSSADTALDTYVARSATPSKQSREADASKQPTARSGQGFIARGPMAVAPAKSEVAAVMAVEQKAAPVETPPAAPASPSLLGPRRVPPVRPGAIQGAEKAIAAIQPDKPATQVQEAAPSPTPAPVAKNPAFGLLGRRRVPAGKSNTVPTSAPAQAHAPGTTAAPANPQPGKPSLLLRLTRKLTRTRVKVAPGKAPVVVSRTTQTETTVTPAPTPPAPKKARSRGMSL